MEEDPLPLVKIMEMKTDLNPVYLQLVFFGNKENMKRGIVYNFRYFPEKKDSDGCTSNQSCNRDKVCAFGLGLDSDGCQICQCADDPCQVIAIK